MRSSEFGKSSERASIISEKKLPKSFLVASAHKASSRPSFRQIASIRHGKSGNGAVFGNAALFLLKVAALETVRRFSKANCPFAWRGLQALQVLCFPPFKWIQRFAPFKGLVKGMQVCFWRLVECFAISVHFMCFVSIANNVDKYIRSSELQFLIIGPCEIFASMRFTESLG